MGPPLLILGVRRSGTTLLRVILDRNTELAVPDESYFIPQLASRHRGRVDVEAFVDDLRRLPTPRDWGISPGEVRERIPPDARAGEAIAAIYEAHAAREGKIRWGDKTPMYMQYIGLLDRLFPSAAYVHLIRDGRDAAVSYLAVPVGIMTEAWGHPRDAASFACQWRSEVLAARALGRKVGPGRFLEVRYESLVTDPEENVARICEFAGLRFEPSMLDYPSTVDVSSKVHQQSLSKAPTPGLRDWRTDMAPDQIAAFERVAGDVLTELGYQTVSAGRPDLGARLARWSYAAKGGAWRTAGSAMQRSPLWQRRHPPLV